jgi:Protein of unknown function (DUF4239)
LLALGRLAVTPHVNLLDAWLSLPLWQALPTLAAFYCTSALLLLWFSFSATTRPWIRKFQGVVAPFVAAVVTIFAILVGFLANDVWDRSRRASAAVRVEATNLISLHALAEALGKPHESIDRAIREYAIAVVSLEWPSMRDGEPAPEAEAAQDELLQVVANSDPMAANYALDRMLLDTALKVREARIERLTLSSDFAESDKWVCVLLMALMAQISVASVHLNEARAQFAAMVIFTACTILVIGLITAHERPFLSPLGVTSDPIAALLDIVPSA